eukprot:1178499-Amorphochlora_amoeboformis.AAC.1
MLHGMGIGTEEIRSTGSRFVFYRSSMLVSNVGDTRMRNVLPVWEQSAVQSRAGEFVPLAIQNNTGGIDANILKRYK